MQFAIVLRAAAASALLFAAGCFGARGDIELVEARLRQQQDLNDRYARDLLSAERERDQARHETELLRQQIADAGQQSIPPELAQSLFAVRGIEFNTLMSGGRDRDGQPGDDVLVAVFVPRDENGDIVKLPGAIELEAVDLNRPEAERQVGKWTFTADQSRKLWKSGAFSSGYQLEVPLTQDRPADKVILHAKLSTADGRQFAATHTITLKRGETAVATGSASAGMGATGSASASRSAPAVINADAEAPGRATITPIAHEETQPVSTSRSPRPLPLSGGSGTASVPVPAPADDAFTPPPEGTGNPFADDASNPFADPPAEEAANPFAPAASEAPAESATVNKPAPVEPAAPVANPPRPFPDGTRTSDRFTDETIPFVR